MKKINKFIGKVLYEGFYALQEKLGWVKHYSGETAPYCGHGYWGHNGYFTQGRYDEVGGYSETVILRWLFYAGHHDDEGYYFGFLPCFRWMRMLGKSIKVMRSGSVLFVSWVRPQKHGKFVSYVCFDFRKVSLKYKFR